MRKVFFMPTQKIKERTASMQSATAAQLNSSFPEATEFLELPVQMLGRYTDKNKKTRYNPFHDKHFKPLSRGKLKILSLIYTYKKRYGEDVKFPIVLFARKLKMSRTTVKKCLIELQTAKLISNDGKDEYSIIPKVEDNDYIIIENYLHKKQFSINDKIKRLSPTAVIVFERIVRHWREIAYKTEQENRDKPEEERQKAVEKALRAGQFCASEKSLSTYLNLPESTISYALPQIIKAGLIYRNKRLRYIDDNGNVYYKVVQIKGVPGNTSSIFTINLDVLKLALKSEREAYAEIKVDAQLQETEISEQEIEEVYTELREEAESKANVARSVAFADAEFSEIREEINHVTSVKQMDSIGKRYLRRLSELGITEAELNPQYNCAYCNNTGIEWNTGQKCRWCRYKVKQLILSRKIKA